jgi:hypothetical protein
MNRTAHLLRGDLDRHSITRSDYLGELVGPRPAPKRVPLDDAPRLECPAQFQPGRSECGKDTDCRGENHQFKRNKFVMQGLTFSMSFSAPFS